MTKDDITEGEPASQEDEDFVVALEELRNNVLLLLSGSNLPHGVTQRLNGLFAETLDNLDGAMERALEEDDGA